MRYPKGRKPPRINGKNSQITVKWSHEPGERNDLTYFWQNSEEHNDAGIASCSRDTGILMDHFENQKGLFGKTMRQELLDRGYDISTFFFHIEKLPPDRLKK